MGCIVSKPDLHQGSLNCGPVKPTSTTLSSSTFDPKAHTAYNEVASALLVFLQQRGRAVSATDAHHWRTLVQHLIDDHGLTQQGPQVGGPRPMSYVFLVGVRITHFPTASCIPV